MLRDETIPTDRNPLPPHPLESTLAQEWQAAQLAQQHVGEVLGKILEAWRRDRDELATSKIQRDVWAQRALDLEEDNAKLHIELNLARARIAELEGRSRCNQA